MAKSSSHIDDVLLAKYLSGECSEEEISKVETWLKDNPDASQTLTKSRKLFNAQFVVPEEKSISFDVDAAWQKVRSKIDAPPVMDLPEEDKTKTRFLDYAWKIAASVLIIGGLTWFFLTKDDSVQLQYTAQLDETKEFYLPDSSKVILKDNSSLTVNPDYGKENRQVQLAGLAYFDVQKSPDKAFIVSLNGAQVEVLGTQFLVDGKAEDLVKVTVESGKVRLSSTEDPDNASVVLERNQTAELNLHDLSITSSAVSNLNNLYWANKKLTYRQRPLNEVFDELESLFQKSIMYDSTAIDDCQLTAIFRKESFDSIMENLSMSMGFEYEVREDKYFIKSNGCGEE